jgi:hypothetical protein
MGQSWGPSEDQLNALAASNIQRRYEEGVVAGPESDDEDKSDSGESVESGIGEDECDLIASVEAVALQDEYQASYFSQDDIE